MRFSPSIGATLLACLAAASSATGCGSGGGSKEAFCARVVEVPVVRSAEQLQGPEGADTLSRLAGALDRLEKASPADIRPQVGEMHDIVKKLRAAARTTAPAIPASDAELQQFADASDRVVAYAKRTCGIELEQNR